jgi:hypothetical protein
MTKAKYNAQDLGVINWVGTYWKRRPAKEVGSMGWESPTYLKIVGQARLRATWVGDNGKKGYCRHWKIVRHYENISRLEGMVGVGQ